MVAPGGAAPEPPVTKGRRLAAVAVTLVAVCGALVAFIFDPLEVSFLPPCLFHLLTGFHCPGCGTQRALHSLLRGDVAAAMGYNVLFVIIAVPFFGYLLLDQFLIAVAARPLPKFRPSAWLTWLIVGAFLVFAVLRNVPVAPFSWLAP